MGDRGHTIVFLACLEKVDVNVGLYSWQKLSFRSECKEKSFSEQYKPLLRTFGRMDFMKRKVTPNVDLICSEGLLRKGNVCKPWLSKTIAIDPVG